LLSHLSKTQQEVLLGLNMSIDANKLLQLKMSLVNYNALLTAATLNVSEGNTQNVDELIAYLKSKLQYFVCHNFAAN
jgi:hypothetical protein